MGKLAEAMMGNRVGAVLPGALYLIMDKSETTEPTSVTNPPGNEKYERGLLAIPPIA